MNYFLLQDLEEAEVDAIIVTTASKKEIEKSIAKAKKKDDYCWEDLIECMPENTRVIECFNKDNRVYY